MMMYLDESNAARCYDEFAMRMSEFMGVIRNPEILADCVNASRHVLSREYYKALMVCRKLIEYENERIGANVAPSLSTGVAAG
jgi:flagellar protein FlbT